ncbi:MAG: efflux RND transporter periplasmic adaptor subunit [Candidatus Methylomirabilales bacterium]|nr:efflux RND transporter periplasmic adaptor subunit [candidate division NC10 bacterium]
MKASEWIHRLTLSLLIPLLFLIPALGACSREPDTLPSEGVPRAMADEKGHEDAEKQTAPEGHQETEPHGHAEPHPEVKKSGEGGVSLSAEEQANIGLKTVPAELRLVEDIRLLNGVVKPHPDRVALVTSRVTGRAVAIHVKLGDHVKKGQDLADVQSVELEKVELDLIQAENKLSLAQADQERIRVLVEKGIAAKKDLLAVENEHQAVVNEIDSLARQLSLLGITEEGIKKVRREKTVATLHLHAPIAGTVVERNIILGQAIEPGQPLFKILDDSVVIVEGDAFEDTLSLLRLGQQVRVRAPAWPKQIFEGRITFISTTVDPEKRTVHVWAEISNHHGMLKQDLFVDLGVAVGGNHRTAAIPLEALISSEGEDFVFVEQGGVFVRRDLVLGARDDRYIEVKEGLRSGERVVTDGKRQLYTKYLMSRRGGAALGGHGH